jgi:hypothetical protein
MNKIKTLSIVIFVFGILTINAMAESSINIPVSHRPNQRVDATTYGSYNWAGYAVHTGTYTSVSGAWIVPKIQTGSPSGYSSAWIGIGGFSGNSVIQIGTEQDCSGGSVTGGADSGAGDNGEKKYHEADSSRGNVVDNKPNSNTITSRTTISKSCKPSYYAWWEMYPQNAEQIIPSLTITPGDKITASVIQSGSFWNLTITDTTTGKAFSTIQTPNFVPDQGSAETIMERPALCNAYTCKLTNLDNFGIINFNSVSSNNGAFDSSADGIIMVDSSMKVMTNLIPNPITTPGVFSVQWVRNN